MNARTLIAMLAVVVVIAAVGGALEYWHAAAGCSWKKKERGSMERGVGGLFHGPRPRNTARYAKA